MESDTPEYLPSAPQATSTYHGLALQLKRRFANGLSYIAAYTWSHVLDDGTATNFSTYLTPRRAQDFQNLKADWATSGLDCRQRFTFTPIYEFRPFRGSNWLMKSVIGNWNVSGTYTYESPEFATVQSNLDSNLHGDSAGDRAIIDPNALASGGPNTFPLHPINNIDAALKKRFRFGERYSFDIGAQAYNVLNL